MNIYERTYARQEYMTPGAPETADIVTDATRPGARVLDVASGKGEAACVLAERSRTVVACDAYDGYLRYTGAKAARRGVGDRVALVRGDGRRLPFGDGAFDTAYCIGAPSIVGLERCLSELARVTRAVGAVVVSDITWRARPNVPLGPEWGWVANFPQTSRDEYAAALRAAGLTVEDVRVFGRDAWDAYHAPMLDAARDERAAGDGAFAAQVEAGVALERRAADAYLDYVAFRCRKT
jgi:SAM-dependent methyltransferase